MMTAAERARLTIVLVGARNPSNIGAAARAMMDFGFVDLRVVNTYAAAFEASQLTAQDDLTQQDALPSAVKSAVGAGEVMRQARRFETLTSALADCTFVAGTTAIGERALAQPVVTLREAVPDLLRSVKSADSTSTELNGAAEVESAQPGARRTAILFGSEKTGLTREQLSFCSLLMTIPMFAPDGRHLSMNLGQSVAVVLYELVRDGFEGAREHVGTPEAPATVNDRERLLSTLLEIMQHTGYARRFPANAREHVVRQLAGQLGATHLQATTWMGLLKQILKPERPPRS